MLTEYGFTPDEKEIYSSSDLAKCMKEKELWQRKYIELLEEHNKLLLGKLDKKRDNFSPKNIKHFKSMYCKGKITPAQGTI